MASVEISKEGEAAIERLIASGVCKDASEAVRISLHMLHDHLDDLKELREFVEAGIEDARTGRFSELESVEELLKHFRALREQRLAHK